MRRIEYSSQTVLLERAQLPEVERLAFECALASVRQQLSLEVVEPSVARANPGLYAVIHPEEPNAFLDAVNAVVYYSERIHGDNLSVSPATIFAHEIIHNLTIGEQGGNMTNIGFAVIDGDIKCDRKEAGVRYRVSSIEKAIQGEEAFNNYPFDPEELKITEGVTDLLAFLLSPDAVHLGVMMGEQLVMVQNNIMLNAAIKHYGLGDVVTRIVLATKSGSVSDLHAALNDLEGVACDPLASDLFFGVSRLFRAEIIAQRDFRAFMFSKEGLAGRAAGF